MDLQNWQKAVKLQVRNKTEYINKLNSFGLYISSNLLFPPSTTSINLGHIQ